MSRCSSPLSISRSAEMGKAAVRECARDVVGHTDQDSAEPLVDNVRSADDEIILRRDFQKLGRPPLQKSSSKLTMYDGTVKHSLGEYCIEVDPAVLPVQNRLHRLPYKMQKTVEEKLASMENAGIVAKVKIPTSWISNMTTVWKSGKAKVRICLDPRYLNKAGKYRWLRLPFGLSSAPEEFQRRLQAVLYEIDGVVVVADDILIYGKGDSQEEVRDNHDEALLQVLRQARKCNLKFNKDKLRLHVPELQYIGHRISSEGVTKPLRRLTENNVTFGWSECEQIYFDQVKTLIAADLLLAYNDASKPVTIHCDASTDGLGATLLQEGRPVVSVSRSLSKRKEQILANALSRLPVETVGVESEQEEVFQAELEVELLEISAVQGKDAVHVRDQRLVEVQKDSVGDEERKVLQGLVI
eukprot:Em0001g2546a